MSLMDWLPWRRERETADLADELRAHLEMAEADRIARGESPSDAAANARREFGNVGLVLEVARDQWSATGMVVERVMQDVRFALRTLRRAPVFATVAILTIALGIGATTAIFSVVSATLLHPLPYPGADQLVRIEDDLAGLGSRDIGMSTPEWHDLQKSGVFDFVSPTWYDDNNLTGVSRPQRVSLLIVAPNYFSLLGVRPQVGVAFDSSDPTPGFNEQAIISDGIWQRAFGGRPDVIGRIVQLDSDSYKIIGVMPPGFQAPGRMREERSTDVWVGFGFAGAPLNEASVTSRVSLFPGAIARVKRGLTVDQAQQRIDVLTQSLRAQYPADYPPRSDWRVRLVPLKDNIVGDVRQPLLFVFAAVGLVLLVACANVANLLLARSTARGRELAVRQALGGAPGRLARQLLTESVVLSAIGGAAGVALLLVARGSLARLVPDSVPRLNDITIDWSVLLFAFAASALSGIVFGLAPVWQIRRLDVTRVLKQEGRSATGSTSQRRTRRALVIAEFAVSLVLLSSAGLLLRSFWGLLNVPLGFDPRSVTVVRTRLPYPNDAKEDLYANAAAEAPFVRAVMGRLRVLPGVEDVALGSGAAVPLDHPQQDQTQLRVVFEERQTDQPLILTGSEVTSEYFRVLGMSLVRGRLLNDFDNEETPFVAVIDESMARIYWPNEDPIGKRLKLSPRATAWTTIVGTVADTRSESLANASVPHLYASLYQRQGKHLSIFLRGRIDAATIERDVRQQVQAVNPSLPVFGAKTLGDAVSASLAVRRFAMQLIALFAGVALVLAALGIYGVIAYMVSERTHEIGVRLALGAHGGDVMRLVMRQGMELAVIGAGVGLGVAAIVSRAMSDVLFGVRPMDPLTFVAATVVLGAAAFAGCYVPARRAVRLDPVTALRS